MWPRTELMTTWIDDIRQFADGGELTRQQMERAEQGAPYSVLPALLYLKNKGVKGNEDVL